MQELAIEPQKLAKPIDPDVKFLKRMEQFKTEQAKIEDKISMTDNDEEKKILMGDLEDLNKRKQNYQTSFRVYRKTQKFNSVKEVAGERNATEVNDIILGRKKSGRENPGVGEEFLKSLEDFKRGKSIGL